MRGQRPGDATLCQGRNGDGGAADPQKPLLEIRSLRKKFGELEVLKDISLSVRPSEVLAIVGASGSGKSTLLRCINLLEEPSGGEIVFANRHVYPNTHARKEELRTHIGMVFQNFNLWPHMTVLENVVKGPIHVKGIPRKEATAAAKNLLASIGLSEKMDAYPSRLSGGQQQRVAIVRALAMSPKLMLFDEVTSALDPELVGEVLQLMARLADEGMTMLVVTHEIAFARDVSHRTIFIDQGAIEEDGPSGEILVSPRKERTRQFLRRVLHESIS
jgi:polar amino acid transport system ATP-binding protein